ncbi:MAG: hypothetical protein LW712_16275 [Burkholderiaceae bacterium]|jgi:hypothetical protein|nr:hypothetical protein [Burkholderiaceae bacterium]
MTIQLSTGVRNSMLEAYEVGVNGQAVSAGTGSGGSVTGTAAQPKLRLLTGSMPANPAAAQTGTQILEMTLPADWAAAASAGVKSLSGTWQAAAAASGLAAYYRIVDNAGTTCHEQGTCGQQVALTTNALTAANGNVLNFAATTGVVVGMNVAGAGIPAGATVVAVGGTTVTLSATSTAGVANAAAITFTQDLTLDNATINSGQTVTITAKSLTAPNA